MKVIKQYNIHNDECLIDLVCENCGKKKKRVKARNTQRYWTHVIPVIICPRCGKSTYKLRKQDYVSDSVVYEH